jgi:hypothetical protein
VVVRAYVWVNGGKLNSRYWDMGITVAVIVYPVVIVFGLVSPDTTAISLVIA